MSEALIVVVLVAAAAWLWYESRRAREAPTRAGRTLCEADSAQFLDEPVVLAGMNLGWQGQPAPFRSCRFDYCVSGADRATGLVHIERGRIVHIQLVPPERLH